MSVTATGSAERLDIGEALQEVLKAFGQNLGPLVLLAILLAGLPLSLVSGGAFLSVQHPEFALLSLVGVIAFIITRPILFGAVIFLTVRALDGQHVTFLQCLTAGKRRWGTMLGLTIWTSLLYGLGFIFLIVPGVYLALQWAVAGPAVVLSSRGIADSMDESARLTKGRRWGMLLFYLVVFVGYFVAAFLLTLVGQILTLVGPKLLMTMVTGPLGSVLFDIVVPLVAAVLYRRLRGQADGPPAAALAEVFA